ncbi:hypothetical protein HY249_01785 [Candidatus Azambacteria bacterium]|nr:hypothetical protein [Candidatus Azambacteria bacterium]
MKKFYIAAYIAIFSIITFTLGVIAGGYVAKVSLPVSKLSVSQKESGAALMPIMGEVRAISGIVKSIADDKIIISADPMGPTRVAGVDLRTILTSSSTKVTLWQNKDRAIFEKELAKFTENIKKIQKSKEPVVPELPPEPFTRTEIKLSEIKEGDRVAVEAGKDIKDSKEFTAVSIMVQKPIAPPISQETKAEPQKTK